jgi:hypothetical protein
MPFSNEEGFQVEIGELRTATETVSGVGTANVGVEVSDLVSVEEVVDVRVDGEEVNEGSDLAAESTSITDNTVTVQFYNGDGSNGIDTASDGDVSDVAVQVTASGY